ncbi:MAG: multidrug effflux MFS transporter [Staphylococcus hyicus]|uniref:multidrug effflux MFS transporter n=1 Tax=Staphylococcus hyicus TaxID=1284 RepID=UPI002A820C67|nr:multidrug effflux MFS transporter [Staphylococcus hyicus]MDY3698358.1 multidrug effflux MFS transporter [Staphylococcus hyicus]
MKQKPSVIFILVMAGLAAFGPLSIDMYLPALPQVATTLHTSTTQTQLTLTFFMSGLALGNIIFGVLSDQTGRKRPLIFSLILYIVFSFICALASQVELLIIARFFQGIAGGAGIVLSRAIASDQYKGNDLTKFLAMLMLVNGAAPVFAPMIGGILTNYVSYHVIFYCLSALSILMLLGVCFKVDESLALQHRSSTGFKPVLEDFKQLLHRKTFILPILIQSLTFALFFSYMAASPFILQNLYGLTPQTYSYIFAFTGLGLIGTAQLTARLVDQINPLVLFRGFSIIQLLGAIIVISALINHWTLLILIPGFFLIVASVSGVATLGFSIAMNGQKKAVGSASSLIGLLQYFVGAATTPLVGLMGDHNAIPYIIVLIITLILIFTLHVMHYKHLKDVHIKKNHPIT